MTDQDKERQLWEVARDKLFEKNAEISELKDRIAKLTGENEAYRAMIDTYQRERANETAMMFASAEEDKADRKLFVKNLGWLLSQTREGVERCELDDKEIVTIYFRDGATNKVNVNMDSYTAIVKDVAKGVTE